MCASTLRTEAVCIVTLANAEIRSRCLSSSSPRVRLALFSFSPSEARSEKSLPVLFSGLSDDKRRGQALIGIQCFFAGTQVG